MSVVIARLIGGLGNQMFQYAAGRALSLRQQADLKLDLSGFGAYVRRRYELDTFPLPAVAATDGELACFGVTPIGRSGFLDRARRRLRLPTRLRALPVYREPHFHYDAIMPALRAPVYLDGYWQSERYFSDCAETVRRDFIPADPLDADNATIAAQINAVNAVSLHVRRGDYVDDPATSVYHGVCSPDYYLRAVDYIAARIEAPHVFVFSDDSEWTYDNIRLSVPTTIVKVNSPDRGYRDMQLMAMCSHHIIANSSFGWWGAWLNPSHEKIVVAPSRWFNASKNDTSDLIPKAWVRL